MEQNKQFEITAAVNNEKLLLHGLMNVTFWVLAKSHAFALTEAKSILNEMFGNEDDDYEIIGIVVCEDEDD